MVDAWFYFFTNLVTTKLTKCKLTSNILGRLSPGGTYQHIFNWIKEVTESPLLTVPSGDVKYMFDNSQKIGKTWQLMAYSKQPSSVVTCHAVAKLGGGTSLQNDSQLSPRKWFPDIQDVSNIKSTEKENTVYRALRKQFSEKRLAENTEKSVSDDAVSSFAEVIARSRNVRYCDDC